MKARPDISLTIAILAVAGLGLGEPGAPKVKEGNRLFAEQKYEEALKKYQQAQTDLPDSPEIYFNLGDAEYKMEKYQQAGSLFTRAGQADDRPLKSEAAYNLGNTRYREGKLPEAVAAFKKAIELNPADEDAKFNYEFVIRKLKQQQQQQQQQKPEIQKQEEKEAEKKPSPSPQPQSSPKPQPQEMTPEEAERMLNGMQAEEQEQRQEKSEERPQNIPEVRMDW